MQTWALCLLQTPALTCNFTFTLFQPPAFMCTRCLCVSVHHGPLLHCNTSMILTKLVLSTEQCETRVWLDRAFKHTLLLSTHIHPSSANTSAGLRYATEPRLNESLRQNSEHRILLFCTLKSTGRFIC